MTGHHWTTSARGRLIATLLAGGAPLYGCYEGVPVDQLGAGEGEDEDGVDSDGDDDATAAACELGSAAATVRMLNRREYHNTLRDLLGLPEDSTKTLTEQIPADAIVGFDNKAESLVASALLVEQQLAVAEAAAAQANLYDLVSCTPATPDEEDGCADALIETLGRRAFRRPLDVEEHDLLRDVYEYARDDGQGFDAARRLVVQSMLQSPQFLYRVETGVSAEGGSQRVTDYELASRLSYLLWASMPDDALLDAAERGELQTTEQVEQQARRMLADERAQDMTRDFFGLWLGLHELEAASKDPALVPNFDDLRTGFRRETEAFVQHVMWDGDGRADSLLLSDTIFVNDDVAELYGIAGQFGVLVDAVPATAERFGLLTQGSLLAQTANDDRTSPTRRGKLVRARLLCQEPPPPPDDVEMLPTVEQGATMRERLQHHVADPACSGCHLMLDPIGFGMEQYDLVGAFRTAESGTSIDASGELSGLEIDDPYFTGVRELSERLVDAPEYEDCVARQWFEFAMGREPTEQDECALDRLQQAMAESDGDMQQLLVDIATSEALASIHTETTP